jgi:phage terminase large subunit GpA-like protein
MLAITEPGTAIITVMVCTQLMKTALIENAFGFFAHLDPSPMLMLQPKEDAAEQFSKERITPLIKATPVLRDLVGTRKTRNSDETIRYKSFPGGFLAIEGAGSPDNVARRPIKRVFCDEIDKYVPTREGDAVGLAEERMGTFVGAQSIRACSPTIEGESAIETSYNEGDQRQATVACPHCGHRQFLEFFAHIDWDKDHDADGNVIAHHPKTAAVHCEACGSAWTEAERLAALQTARWHQTKHFRCCDAHQSPLASYEAAWRDGVDDPVGIAWDWWEGPRWAVYRARCSKCGSWPVDNEHASFTAGKEFSPWDRDAPPKMARKWLLWKDDPDQRVKFDNTQRGKPHRRAGSKMLQAEVLAARAENWPGDVPDGVGIITAGVDTQDDRVEIEFVGWGHNEESWSLAYVVVDGDTSSDALWDRVDEQLLRSFRRDDGREFTVAAACVDSGGHRVNEVYRFAQARLGRKVWAIKGASERSGTRQPIWPAVKPTRRDKGKFRPVSIGTNAAKDTIRARLDGVKEAGPGFMHFDARRELGWYEQLIAERRMPKVVGGRKFTIWECPKGKANEALDCRVYAYAALQGLIHFGARLNEVTDLAAPMPERPADDAAAPVETASREATAPKKPAWVKPRPDWAHGRRR